MRTLPHPSSSTLGFIFSLAFLGLSWAPVQGADRLALSLYLGQHRFPLAGENSKPQASPRLTERLRSVFGYEVYTLQKEIVISLHSSKREIIFPRSDFFVMMQLRPGWWGGGKIVEFQLFGPEGIVARGTYSPQPKIPVFIEGPRFRGGQLILVFSER